MTPASLALFGLGWACGWFLLARFPPLPPIGPRPAVAVVVPARDEATNLPALLASVTPELQAGDELVVVDDGSTDDTAAVAAAGGARVIPAPPLPEGWTGKAHACWCGAQAAAAPVVVFLDADVTLAAGALDRLVPVAVETGTLVSVQPWHRTQRPYEQASVLFNLAGPMGSAAFALTGVVGSSRLAFGPVLVTTRAAYEQAGGHAHPDVRGQVAEDLALARRYGTTRVFLDRRLASFRMYPGGWRQLLEGWTKNLAAGAASLPWWVFAVVVGWLWSLAGGWLTSPWFYGASVAQVWVLGRRVGRFGPLTAALYPLWTAVFLAVFARSLARRWRRRPVRWRGRWLRA